MSGSAPGHPANGSPEILTRALGEIVSRRLGGDGQVMDLTRLTAGGRKATWAFDAMVAGERVPLILQIAGPAQISEPGDPWNGLPFVPGGGEFDLLRSAASAGVPVPHVRYRLAAEDGLGEGAITDRIAGETLGKRIVHGAEFAAARPGMAARLGAVAAAIHRMDKATARGLQTVAAPRYLELYRQTIDGLPARHPALEFAYRWAAHHVPAASGLSLVHGDFRMGNMIVGAEGLRAVLDWETSHLGDAMEDLGYLCMRSWRFGGTAPAAGVGSRDALFAAYEAAGGTAVQPEAVRFWEAMGSIKWALSCLRRASLAARGDFRALDLAAAGRRFEEPLYDLMNLVMGRD
jgi:aminoglycoside phosphotransferase (APT) family kinase protein